MSIASEIIERIYVRAPLVLGHRGTRYRPMNTLSAFRHAIELGADGVELDVHRSKDGYPVIVHDFTVDSTSDGSGDVTQMTLAELKELDAGSWFDSAYAGERIPTLDEVFETLGRDVWINVELKARVDVIDGAEQVVAECIQRHAMTKSVIVSSFEPNILYRFQQIMPDVPIGLLHASESPDAVFQLFDQAQVHAFHPHFMSIDAEMVAKYRQQDMVLNTWTVNDPDVAKQLVELGVQGIISDYPDKILAAIGR